MTSTFVDADSEPIDDEKCISMILSPSHLSSLKRVNVQIGIALCFILIPIQLWLFIAMMDTRHHNYLCVWSLTISMFDSMMTAIGLRSIQS